MPPIRFAIWAAVSSDSQAAADKFSLAEQVDRCRQAGLSRGWLETCQPYMVPGESRTRWVNLSDAERAIPSLHKLLDDAQAGQYDILIVHEFDRLRELLDPVARTLSHYGVQLYSVTQPLEPQAPATYNPYASDTDSMLRGMNQIVSRAAVANLRRKYAAQMPRRILERGLPHQAPYGYTRTGTDKAVSYIQDENAKYVTLIKDRYLSGAALKAIAAEMDAIHAPLPSHTTRGATRWNAVTVLNILQNPFYAGYVRWGMSKSTLDPRTGQTHRTRNDTRNIVTAPGRHEPLWDDTTKAQIAAEIARRSPAYRGRKQSALTGLLRCSVCNAPLWRLDRTIRGETHSTWRCSKPGRNPHVLVRDSVLLENLITHMRTNLTDETNQAEHNDSTDKRVAELHKARERVGDAYTAGIFDLAELTRRTSLIDDELTALETNRRDTAAQHTREQIRQTAIQAIKNNLAILPEYITTADPREINRIIATLYTTLTIDPNGDILNAP